MYCISSRKENVLCFIITMNDTLARRIVLKLHENILFIVKFIIKYLGPTEYKLKKIATSHNLRWTLIVNIS